MLSTRQNKTKIHDNIKEYTDKLNDNVTYAVCKFITLCDMCHIVLNILTIIL